MLADTKGWLDPQRKSSRQMETKVMGSREESRSPARKVRIYPGSRLPASRNRLAHAGPHRATAHEAGLVLSLLERPKRDLSCSTEGKVKHLARTLCSSSRAYKLPGERGRDVSPMLLAFSKTAGSQDMPHDRNRYRLVLGHLGSYTYLSVLRRAEEVVLYVGWGFFPLGNKEKVKKQCR